MPSQVNKGPWLEEEDKNMVEYKDEENKNDKKESKQIKHIK